MVHKKLYSMRTTEIQTDCPILINFRINDKQKHVVDKVSIKANAGINEN